MELRLRVLDASVVNCNGRLIVKVESGEFGGRQVLVVEDDPSLRITLRGRAFTDWVGGEHPVSLETFVVDPPDFNMKLLNGRVLVPAGTAPVESRSGPSIDKCQASD